jgi:F-type H+-transporting ATPase subunit a
VNRWIVLALIVASIFAARAYPPLRPHIQLPAEHITEQPLFTLPIVGEFYLTNTLLSVLLADVLLIVLAFVVRQATRRGELSLKGVPAAVEAVLEALYGLAETSTGAWAKRVFPWMASIIFLVLAVNWMELIPGVDSIGRLEAATNGYPVQSLGQIGGLPVATVLKGAEQSGGFNLVPWVRVASTDLNFTIALAIVSVVVIQIFGFQAHGLGYVTKFLNVKTVFSRPFFGLIDVFVGILELLSEVAKVISLSFRLFGNIFAGSVLLFVIGSLVPVAAQTGFLALEFAVGLIQAIVFGMLTMIFIGQATAGHGQDNQAH